MDRRTNPYAPGAGTPPPELVGRDTLIEDAEIALDRLGNGLAAKSLLMVGLRGVGKRPLNRILLDAEARDFAAVLIGPRGPLPSGSACGTVELRPSPIKPQ